MGQCAFTQDPPVEVDISAPVQLHECRTEECRCEDWTPHIAHLHNHRFLLKQEGSISADVKTTGDFSVLMEREADKEFAIVFKAEDSDCLMKLRFLDIYDFLNMTLKLKVASRPLQRSAGQCEVSSIQTCAKGFSIFRAVRPCKNCGGAFCSSCLPNEAVIPSLAYTSPQPICRVCLVALSGLRKSVKTHKSSFVATRSFLGLRPDYVPSGKGVAMSNMASNT
jgi:hypothetical protein